jgi:glucokinase
MIGAVDIGGTKIAAGMVDATGHVLASLECPTQPSVGFQAGLRSILQMLRATASQAGEQPEGIGIGCTGPVHPELGSIGNVEFLPGWEGANLVAELSQAFGVPAAIENDADAAALGEWAWGVGRGAYSFVLVTVGTGIGAGLVIDGRLYRGVDGSHPEIGHHVIDPQGPACFCGAHGCWESLASGPAMERWAQARHPQHLLRSARQLCTAAGEGDALAQEAVEHTARYLALGLANLVTIFSPEMIALGGGLLQSYSLFRPEIEKTVSNNCGLVPHQQVKIVRTAPGSQAGLVGAARVWYHRFSL